MVYQQELIKFFRDYTYKSLVKIIIITIRYISQKNWKVLSNKYYSKYKGFNNNYFLIWFNIFIRYWKKI
jgi:hypothetical protein